MTQKNADMAEELSHVSRDLAQEGERLNVLIGQFSIGMESWKTPRSAKAA